MTTRVSLAMIAAKDAPTLGRCLSSVADLVDEIVVVTQPGARASWQDEVLSFGAKLVEFTWCDDFSAARNESLRHATGEWILCLDADEWLEKPHVDSLESLLATTNREVVGYRLTQVSPNSFGRVDRASHVRLFRSSAFPQWTYRVFEQVTPSLMSSGEINDAAIEISHDGYRQSQIIEEKRARNSRLLAMDLVNRPNEAYLLFCAGLQSLDERRPSEAVRLLDQSRLLRDVAPFGPPLEELYSALARACALAGDGKTASQICNEGLTRLPENPELLFVAATLRLNAGDTTVAESMLRRSIQSRPRHGRAYQVLADVLQSKRRFDEAENLASRLDRTPEMTIEAAMIRTRVRLSQGDGEGARRILADAISTNPAAIGLRELLASVLLMLKDSTGANRALKDLLALHASHPWANKTLQALNQGSPSC